MNIRLENSDGKVSDQGVGAEAKSLTVSLEKQCPYFRFCSLTVSDTYSSTVDWDS
jgi:hypothetical protein